LIDSREGGSGRLPPRELHSDGPWDRWLDFLEASDFNAANALMKEAHVPRARNLSRASLTRHTLRALCSARHGTVEHVHPSARHKTVEARFCELLVDAGMPHPDRVEYQPCSVVFYRHEPRVAVSVDFDRHDE
jgi:hypothetical protein